MSSDSLFAGDAWGIPASRVIPDPPGRRFTALVCLGGFPASRVVRLSHPERIRARDDWYRRQWRRIEERVPLRSARPGPEGSPARMMCVVAARHLHPLLAQPGVQEVLVLSPINDHPAVAGVPDIAPEWHAVLARFAVQIEGQQRGTQTVLHRLFLVKARNETDALRRLRPKFDLLEQPALNDHGALTRYRLESAVQVEPAGFESPDPGGVEIFTGMMTDRRMKPEDAWHPRREGTSGKARRTAGA